MRYGLISDVHGNLPALEAALTALSRAGVDAVVCAGDLVGYGPEPNEVVEVAATVSILSVAGNHDLMAIGRLSDDRCIPLARESQRWTRDVLHDDVRSYLAALPETLVLPGIVVAHGSLDDPEQYVRDEAEAGRLLGRLGTDHPEAAALVLGHTHRQWVYRPTGSVARGNGAIPFGSTPHLLNPGSVGQSRQWELSPHARFMVLDVDRRECEAYTVPYDHRRVRRALREQDLPRRCIHARPRLVRGALRRLTVNCRNSAGR